MPVPEIDLGDKWVGVIDVSQKPEIKQEVLQNVADQFKAIYGDDADELSELIENWQLIQDQLEACCQLHAETTFYEDDLNRALDALRDKNQQRIAVGKAIAAGEDASALDLGDKWVGVIDVSQKPEIKTEVLQNTYESYNSLQEDELRTLITKWRELAKHLDGALALHFAASQQEDDLNRALDALKDKNLKRIEIGNHVIREKTGLDADDDDDAPDSGDDEEGDD
jgi:hypothetical protein